MYLLFLGLLFAASSAVAGSNESHPLTLSVLLPLSFASLDGDGYLPAMDISLELINNKTDLLPGYTLNAVVNDSAVSPCIVHILHSIDDFQVPLNLHLCLHVITA